MPTKVTTQTKADKRNAKRQSDQSRSRGSQDDEEVKADAKDAKSNRSTSRNKRSASRKGKSSQSGQQESDNFAEEAQRIKDHQLAKWAQGEQQLEKDITLFDGIYSIATLAQSQPNKFKDFLEEFVSCNDEGEPLKSDQTVL